MFESLTSKSKNEIQTIIDVLAMLDHMVSNEKDSNKRNQIKVYSVASCVTRLYAIYENYIQSILSDYLDEISSLYLFESLSERFQNYYRIGFSQILSRIGQSRYNHLSHTQLINTYDKTISGIFPYQFIPEALLRHDQNLRLNTLNELFSKLELQDFNTWITSHYKICEYFKEDKVAIETITSQLTNLVGLRNDAAHGEIDQLPSSSELIEYCNFMASILEAVKAFVEENLTGHQIQKGKLIKIGKITEVFKEAEACILTVEINAEFALNDIVLVTTAQEHSNVQIKSIQLNGKNLTQYSELAGGTEVGLKLSGSMTKNALIYKANKNYELANTKDTSVGESKSPRLVKHNGTYEKIRKKYQ
jgi:hypothetical protein